MSSREERLAYERRILAAEVEWVALARQTLAFCELMERNTDTLDCALIQANAIAEARKWDRFVVEGWMPALLALKEAIQQNPLFPEQLVEWTPDETVSKSGVDKVREHLIEARRIMYDEHWFAQEIDNFLNDESVESEFPLAAGTAATEHCWPASAMSAGTAETQSGSGLQPASAVPNGETPK